MGQSSKRSGAGKWQPLRLAPLFAVSVLAGCGTTAQGAGVSQLALALKERGVIAGPTGADLNEAARAQAANAEYRALEAGQTGAPVPWRVSDAVFGSVVPQQPFSVGPANCRRYSHSITAGGQTRTGTGTACRQEDGSWRPLT